MAPGVHEVPGTGQLPWEAVCVVSNEVGDQREGWILCTLSGNWSWDHQKLLGQRIQYGCDVICPEESFTVGLEEKFMMDNEIVHWV